MPFRVTLPDPLGRLEGIPITKSPPQEPVYTLPLPTCGNRTQCSTHRALLATPGLDSWAQPKELSSTSDPAHPQPYTPL